MKTNINYLNDNPFILARYLIYNTPNQSKKPMAYKRKYHPLIILLYVSNMLAKEQIMQIPNTTLSYWNNFTHDDCYGAEWAGKYIHQFDQIKDVYSSSFLFKSMVFMVQSRQGFLRIIEDLNDSKKMMRKHAKAIIESVEVMRNKSNFSLNTICKYFGISRDWYYAQKRKVICLNNPLNTCFRRHPNQLTQKEILNIQSIVIAPSEYGRSLTTLYYSALRNGIVTCAKSTFFNYAKALGYIKPKYPKPIPKPGVKATRVFEWLHIDITYVPTQNDGIQKVAFVKDNFSKAILHYGSTSGRAGSEFIAKLLEETFDMYNLTHYQFDINILTDGGPENKGKVNEWVEAITAPPIVNKITARTPEFKQSNSMSESTHSIYKTEFMRKLLSINIRAHHKHLALFVEFYNYHRYSTTSYGLAPMEIVNGKIPDKHYFKDRIKQAQIDRIAINQSFNDCVPSNQCGLR